MESGAPEGQAVPAPLVAPGVLQFQNLIEQMQKHASKTLNADIL
jgi:hypothetical protein